MSWFRSFNGMPGSTQLRLVAHKSKMRRTDVTAVWWELYDYASQAEPRWCVKDVDQEIIAMSQDMELGDVSAIIKTFYSQGMVNAEHFIAHALSKQVNKEDETAAERQARKREKDKLLSEIQELRKKIEIIENQSLIDNVTTCHAESRNVTLEQSRAEQIKADIKKEERKEEKEDREENTRENVDNFTQHNDLKGKSNTEYVDSYVDNSSKVLNNNDYLDAYAACCSLLAVRNLSPPDQEKLAKWYNEYDFFNYALPLIRGKVIKFVEKNNKPPASLAYFENALRENQPKNQVMDIVSSLGSKMKIGKYQHFGVN